MFKIIFDSDFNGMFDSGKNPNDVFVNYFKDKHSTTFLFHYLHEHTSRPFSSYDFNNTKSYEELENILVSNNNILYCLYSGQQNVLYNKTKIKNVFFITWPTYLLHYSYYGMTKVYDKPIQEINIEMNDTSETFAQKVILNGGEIKSITLPFLDVKKQLTYYQHLFLVFR